MVYRKYRQNLQHWYLFIIFRYPNSAKKNFGVGYVFGGLSSRGYRIW
jgi:hypothetical protein